MAGDLAAENGVLLAHPDLEEGVAHARQVGAAALGGDDVGDCPARPRVVEDRRPGVLRERGPCEQRADEVPVAEGAVAVDEEAAVGVAVPGDAEVGAGRAHPLVDQPPVLLEQRVRLVVGELAVGLEVELVELEAEPTQDRADHRPGHAVAAVDDDLHRSHVGRVDEGRARGRGTPPRRPPLRRSRPRGRVRGRLRSRAARRRCRRRRRGPGRPRGRASRRCRPSGCGRR